MRVRTFTATTMPDAMAQVRAEMGEDAVILSSQRSKRGVEVKAAAERRPAQTLEDIDGVYGWLAALETERDPAKIAGLLRAAHERLVDNPPWLWIVHDLNPRAMSRRVRGFVSPQSWFIDLARVDMQ